VTDTLYFRIVPQGTKFMALVKEEKGVVIRLGSSRTPQAALSLIRSYGHRVGVTMINKDTDEVATGPMVLDSATGRELPRLEKNKNDAGSVDGRKIEDV